MQITATPFLHPAAHTAEVLDGAQLAWVKHAQAVSFRGLARWGQTDLVQLRYVLSLIFGLLASNQRDIASGSLSKNDRL